MNRPGLWHIVGRELRHRKWSTGAAVLSLAAATAATVFVGAMLEAHARDTAAALDRRQRQVRRDLREARVGVAKAMERLGFNLLLLPEGQNLADWHAEDYACESMPESWAARLKPPAVNTILWYGARLRRRIKWPETMWTVILVGRTRLAGRPGTLRAAEEAPPPAGTVDLGHEIHRGLGLSPGNSLRIMDRSFAVRRCLPERGTGDDITVWLDLGDAQKLLGQPERITEIVAAAKPEVWGDTARIRAELRTALPGVQVVEMTNRTQATALAVMHAARQSATVLNRERESAGDVMDRRRRFAALLNATVLAACAAWLSHLAFVNVKDREAEIGILRALGFGALRIALLFAARWTIVAIAGGAAGCGVGLLAALSGNLFGVGAWESGVRLARLAAALAAALLVTVIAAGAPVFRAARRDAAEILQRI